MSPWLLLVKVRQHHHPRPRSEFMQDWGGFLGILAAIVTIYSFIRSDFEQVRQEAKDAHSVGHAQDLLE